MSRTLLPLTLAAALAGTTALAEVPRVAVDIAPVHSLVARVMQGVGTPDLVIQSGASPHAYALRPSEARALQEADLVFWIGHDLTPWLESSIGTLATGAAVTGLMEADGTIELEFRESALFEAHAHGDKADDEHGHKDHGHEDHSGHADDEKHDDHAGHDHAEDTDHKEHEDHAANDDHADHAEHADHDGHAGHGHGAHDPHAWLSPRNAATWLNVIAGQLSAADPDNAGAYFANAAAGRAELELLVNEVDAILAPVRDMPYVVFHDAYQYFETDFNIPAAGAISLSDASAPSPARIAEIQARVAEQSIACVLAEPQFNAGLVETVLDGTQAKTAVLDPLGASLEEGPALYPQLIRGLATNLASCR